MQTIFKWFGIAYQAVIYGAAVALIAALLGSGAVALNAMAKEKSARKADSEITTASLR
jgi:hypothetical protein